MNTSVRTPLIGAGVIRLLIPGVTILLLTVATHIPEISSHVETPSPGGSPSPGSPGASQMQRLESYGRLPLSFEANRGQTDVSVKFISRGIGYTLFLTSTEAVLAMRQSHDAPSGVVRIRLLESNPSPRITGREILPGKTNYFAGNAPKAWLRDLPTYRSVEYADVYPGIGLVYHGRQRELEYDFVVAPRADYRAIRLAIVGAGEWTIDSSGAIVLNAGSDEFRIRKPEVYQEGATGREAIDGEFVRRGRNEVGFRIAPYDREKPLIIDPVVSYSYWISDGTSEEHGAHIALDKENNAYIAGSTHSTSFPVLQPVQPVLGTGGSAHAWDAFVVKINAAGTAIVYSTYLGSYQDDDASDIVVDQQGCAYVVGTSASKPDSAQTPWNECFPLKNPLVGKYSLKAYGTLDVFITKLSAAGNELVYSTLLGGEGNDGARSPGRTPYVAVAVDNSGSAYVAGYTESGDFPLVGSFRPRGKGFVAKLSASGSSLLYSSYIGAENEEVDPVFGIAVDQAGNAYIAGAANKGSTFYFDAFVQKVDPSGSQSVYMKLFGGTNAEIARGIAVDSIGNVYVTGYTFSSDFPLTNAFQNALHGQTDAFVTKFDPSGQTVYSTYLGGESVDWGFDICIDRTGSAYVTGLTSSADFPTADPIQPAMKAGDQDAFVARLTPEGNRLAFSTFLGGSDVDAGLGIALDAAASIYVTGVSQSNDFPTTVAKTYPSGTFVAKLAAGAAKKRIQVWQELRVASPGAFKAKTSDNVVTIDGFKCTITRVVTDTISILVPPELVKNRELTDAMPDTTEREVTVIVRIVMAPGDTVKTYETVCVFVPPRLLIHDEVTRATPPLRQGVLLQAGWADAATFMFLGSRTDGTAAVRLTNTSTAFPAPISLLAKVISPPPVTLFDAGPWPSVGNLLSVGISNAAIQFPIDRDGWYIIVVMGGPLPNPPVFPEVPNSPGPFPAQFQIHLAGNVGLPRKLINGAPEFPRGIRLDTYFNHLAPRTETLGNNGLVPGEWAETGLFKFANPVSVSRFPIAVLLPPAAGGFPIGRPPVRAAPPLVMGQLPNRAIDITVPMATTRGAANPVPGTVIDFAQVPIPASVLGQGPPQGAARILGQNDGSAATLPIATTEGPLASIIVDMGSGNEIVNGNGADFRVIALSGTYQTAVSNTPFDGTFRNVGSGTGQQDFDIGATGLAAVRYVRLSAAGTDSVRVDAVEALNLFADQVHPTAGPLSDVGWATITMRDRKSPSTSLDPMLELIGPDGSALGKNDSGFGDDLDPARSDAALVNVPLTQEGFYRFLGRGYDIRPDAKAFGTYLARLETGGEYDPVELAVSTQDETRTIAQKKGSITLPRQRDSYLFQASSGTRVNIVVSGAGTSALADPLVELYDPEDFLIAANDNYEGRGNTAVVSVTLPTTGRTYPDPSTYRIVVMGVNKPGAPTTSVSNSQFYARQVNGGSYELKVFTGPLYDEGTKAPVVTAAMPNAAIRGSTNVPVAIAGTNFANGATAGFSGTGVTVTNVDYINSGQITATVDVAANAPIGPRTVTVTNPGGLNGSASGAFLVTASLGSVVLNWSAPPSGQSMQPPGNLSLVFDPNKAVGSSAKIFSAAHKRHMPSAAGNSRRASALIRPASIGSIIQEKEPNNTAGQAQTLAGDSLLEVSGRAEVMDVGAIEDGGDDIEDLFKVTIRSPGLSILLSGFTSDCDLFLIDPEEQAILDASTQASATADELIEWDDLPAGSYLIGVSIYDDDPLGPDSTAYILMAAGDFGGSATQTLRSYSVYRSVKANAKTTGKMIGDVAAGTTSYTERVPHTGIFYYQVTAVYDQGESAPSNEISKTVTEVKRTGGDGAVPAACALLQNYPNPFNPFTTIGYRLSRTARVTLSVFNVLGGEVAVLVNETQSAGEYIVRWDASGQASGVYFYRLQAGAFTQTRHLILLK